MRSTKTRLSAVFITLLLTVGIVAPAAAAHADPHTAWLSWQAAEAALDEIPNGNDHREEREAAQNAVDEKRQAFYASGATLLETVSLCHATGNVADPYNQEPNVNPNSVISGGHGGHTGPVFDSTMTTPNSWGDIIPEFYFEQGNQIGYYPGLNWNDAGKAIWEADCIAATDADGGDDDGGEDPLPEDPPTVTVEDDAVCATVTDAIKVLLDNPTDADVTFLGTLSIDGTPVAAGNYLDYTVAAEDSYLFEDTAPVPATYAVTWQAFADYDAEDDDQPLASGSFTITATDCSDSDTYPVLPTKAWSFPGLDGTDQLPAGEATIEVSYVDGEDTVSEEFEFGIGDADLPAPWDIPTTVALADVDYEEVSYDVPGFTCTASYPDVDELADGELADELTDDDVRLLPVVNTCTADGPGEQDVVVTVPTVYELEAAAQEVCLPDDLREVIALELDGTNIASADVELQDADGNTLDTVTNLNLNASPHQLDWPVDGDGELHAEVTLIVTSPQRPQLEVAPIVLTLDDVALDDCTEVGGIVDENPEPQPEPQPQPQPEPQPQPKPVDADDVEVRDVVLEREVPVARGNLPRTGASTVAIVLTGLLSLLTGGALLRSGRREEDAS